MVNMEKINKNIGVIVLLILAIAFGYYFGSKNSTKKNGDLFVWEPSKDIKDLMTSPSKNITDSATCSFKKSFNTFFQQKITNSELNPPERIYYDIGDDNEADTLTFTDLTTDHPKVTINSGTQGLTILNDNTDTITMINLNGINDPITHVFSTYKIFKKKGLLIYTDSADSYTLIGPTGGALEMGYCH